jgi:hypothetical protein
VGAGERQTVERLMQHTGFNKHRWAFAASWFAACIPPCLILAIGVSAAYVRLSLGRWPVVYRDTVHAPFAEAAIVLAAISAYALFPSALLLPLVSVGRALSGVRPVFGRWAIYFVIGWLTAFFLMRWDPYGFIDWIID